MRASCKVAADERYHADRVSTKRRQAYAHKNHSMEKSLRAARKVAADYHADRVSTKRRQAHAHKNHSMEKSLRAARKVAVD